MNDVDRDTSTDGPLNPALKITPETAYDPDHTTPSPFDSTSAKAGEGKGWPLIWLAVVVACVIVVIYLIV